MSLQPLVPSRSPVCLCACSMSHPDHPGICNYRNPIVMVDQSPSDIMDRIPMCEPCARITDVPILTNDEQRSA